MLDGISLLPRQSVLPKSDTFLEKKEETTVSKVFKEFEEKGGAIFCYGSN